MAHQIEKDAVFDELAQSVQALASPIRLRILQALTQRPMSVEEISHFVGQPIANTSQHLQKMKAASLVRASKEGVSRIYRLTHPKLMSLWSAIQQSASEQSANLKKNEELFSPVELCSPFDLSEALSKVFEKKALLIDIRPREEFSHFHAPGAMNIPGADFKGHVGTLPASKIMSIYCRGRYCGMANPIVSLLRKNKFKSL